MSAAVTRGVAAPVIDANRQVALTAGHFCLEGSQGGLWVTVSWYVPVPSSPLS